MEPSQLSQEPQSLHFLDYWRVIRARKEIILVVMVLVVITGLFVTNLMEKRYRATSSIEIYQDSDNMKVFSPSSMGNSFNPYFLLTQQDVMRSEVILGRVVENLDLRKKWGNQFEEGYVLTEEQGIQLLKNRLSVVQKRNTSIVEITAVSSVPAEAALIANEVASVYKQHRKEYGIELIRSSLAAMEALIEEQNQEVIAAEDRLEEIREELGLSTIDIGVRITAESQRVQQLQADLMSYRVDMLTRKARLDELEQLEGDGLINALLMSVQDMSLVTLRNQRIDFEVQLSMMLENLGENHPDVRQARQGLKETKGNIQSAIDGIKSGLRTDYMVAKSRVDALEAELEKVEELDRLSRSQKLLPFQRAERDVRRKRTILASLQARVAQEGVDMALPRVPIKVIEEATVPREDENYSPNLLLNLVLSVVVGGFCGVGLAFFIEYLDTSVKTVDDVERYLETSVIGVIPQKVKTLNLEGIESPHAESYRVLRTNLQFSHGGKPGGLYTVTSGGVGEGKSTTLFNLAFVCAALGDKTLVVDSDMRRPVQHKILGISNRTGLADVLLRDARLEDTIQPTEYENLHILPSGQLSSGMVGMLNVQKIRSLMSELRSRYDYVLFDSPPIMGISDSSILAREVDGVMLVVQYRKYPRQMSARAKRLVENAGGTIAGVVLNNINILRDDYYYYNSYYSHYTNATPDLDAPAAAEETEQPSEERF